jgi:hypothetical protein
MEGIQRNGGIGGGMKKKKQIILYFLLGEEVHFSLFDLRLIHRFRMSYYAHDSLSNN